MVGVRFCIEKIVDEVSTFVGAGIGEKGGGLFRCWNATREIEEDAAKEFGIGGSGRRLHAIGAHFLIDELVDEIGGSSEASA